MLLSKPHLLTKLEIWYPKYHTETEGYEVWILKSKVAYSSPILLIDFTRAKHLQGQRFCVRRQVVENSPVGTNGRSEVYKVPFDKLESWETAAEVRELAFNIFRE